MRDIECLSAHQDDVQNTYIQTIISQFIMQIHGRDDGESVLTDIQIEIEIRACNVPDLELVDLPGILYGNETLQGQTESLTRAYLRKPHTLVLCVIDGNSPTLRGASILPEIRNMYPKTIIVQTKTDHMVDLHGPTHLYERLANPGLQYQPAAIIPLINRGDHQMNLQENGYEEMRVFEDYKAREPRLQAKPMGILAVLSKLNELFESHMCDVWVPQERRKLEDQKARASKELDSLGKRLSNSDVGDVLGHAQTVMRTLLESSAFDNPQDVASPWVHWPQIRATAYGRCTPHRQYPGPKTTRLSSAEDRIHSQREWRRNVDEFDMKWLIDHAIDRTMQDDALPLRIRRLATLREHLKAALPMQTWKTDLSGAPLPPDLTSNNLQSKLVDTAFATVLVPMLHHLSSDAMRSYLMTRPDWFQESPEVAASRAELNKRMGDIDAARVALSGVESAAGSGKSSHR